MGCCGQRDLFVTGPGPDAGGSNQGKAGCVQTPVNSGIGAAPFVTPLAGPLSDAMVCPRAGIAVAAVNAMYKRKVHCLRMPTLPSIILHERLRGRYLQPRSVYFKSSPKLSSQ